VLGLSLTKILFTVLVIVAVWRAFALLNRLQERQRQAVEAARRGGRRDEPSRGGRPSSSRSGVVEMVQCPACGAYVPRGQPCRCTRRGG
jgi:hypothetical protein